MEEQRKKETNAEAWLHELLSVSRIAVDEIPDIELYMDQVTTFMESHLADSRRYPEDKILTKTMINNYTKNHLLPPSVKKKYSKEHLILLIMIYHLKSMLSISDIQTALEPLSEKYFPKDEKSGLSLAEIYEHVMNAAAETHSATEAEITQRYEASRNSFPDAPLTPGQQKYLDDFVLIYQLCYDIYVRKQMIEKLIDRHKEEPTPKKGKKK